MSEPPSPRNEKNSARQKRYRENKKRQHETEIANLRQEIDDLSQQVVDLKCASDYWSPEESASWRIRALVAERELEEIKMVLKILRGNNSSHPTFFRGPGLKNVSNSSNKTSRDGVRDGDITVDAVNLWDSYISRQ